CADTLYAGRDAMTFETAGESAAVALNSSSAAVTSRWAMDCVPPDSGTPAGTPALRTAAWVSTITDQTRCSHASHTTTDRTLTIVITGIAAVSRETDGLVCGTGRPRNRVRANGTPSVSAASKITASRPDTTSPAVRPCRAATGRRRPGMGGAISMPPVHR